MQRGLTTIREAARVGVATGEGSGRPSTGSKSSFQSATRPKEKEVSTAKAEKFWLLANLGCHLPAFREF